MRMRLVVFALPFTLCLALAAISPAQESSSTDMRKVVQRIDPMYPSIAKRMNLAGTVKLIAVVAPDGKVKHVEPVGGSPVLIQAARDAVARWKYAPAGAESREPIEVHFNPGPQD